MSVRPFLSDDMSVSLTYGCVVTMQMQINSLKNFNNLILTERYECNRLRARLEPVKATERECYRKKLNIVNFNKRWKT